MGDADFLAKILSHESLDGLAAFLHAQPQDAVRSTLLELFDAHAEYEDADQWAAAVRICESLAIVGWSSREPVDAISHFNGDCWETHFVTADGRYRFRAGSWRKRKAGWVLVNPAYHFSPDRPEKPAVAWHEFARVRFAVVERPSLPSQRNYRKQMPVVMGQFGGFNEVSRVVAKLKQELRGHLRDAMRPALYGEALEHFYFTLHCKALSESCSARLEIGSYNRKHKVFYCDLYFDDAFARCRARDQRDYFAVNLLAAIDALQAKLARSKIDYDLPAFRSDVVRAIEAWHAKSNT